MQVASLLVDGNKVLGFRKDERVIVLDQEFADQNNIPATMEELVQTDLSDIKRIKEFINNVNPNDSKVKAYTLDDITFDAPIPKGKKIICVGLNYSKHADESNMELPKVPLLFSKFDNTLTGHNRKVKRPDNTEKMDFEAEVGVVIGRTANKVNRENALDYVFGYTNANDLSARDLQFITSQWLVGKNCDSFCPAGPFLVTPDEIPNPNDLTIKCIVNGRVEQEASTSQMIFSFEELISYISHCFTLEPGDLILTGTPEGVILGRSETEQNWLKPGDVVVVEVEKLGSLKTIIS